MSTGDILALETTEDTEIVKGNGNGKKAMVSQLNNEAKKYVNDFMEETEL